MSRKRHKYSKKQANKNSRTPHKRSRKIKINKKQKKYHNKIMKLIKQYFPKNHYTIETAIEKNGIHFFIKNCLHLKFEADNIYIDRLDKCSDSGTILLSKIKDVAQKLGLKYVSLVNGSEIVGYKHSFSLSYLQILTTGQSWYNKYGYVSSNYKKELANNKKIIAEPFIKTFDKAIKKYKNNDYQSDQINKTRIEETLEYVNSLISKNETHPFMCRQIVEMNKKLKEIASDNTSVNIPKSLQIEIDCNNLLTLKTYLEELLKNINSSIIKKYNNMVKKKLITKTNTDKEQIIKTLNRYVPKYKSMKTQDVFKSLKNNPQFRKKKIDYSESLDKLLSIYWYIILYDVNLTYTL